MRALLRRAWPGLAAALLLAGCATGPRPQRPAPIAMRPAPPPPPVRKLPPGEARTAAELGVSAGPAIATLDLNPDRAAAALAGFRLSCRALNRRVDASGLTRPGDWQPACADGATASDAVAFFQRDFETAVIGSGATFDTGYYEPEIDGSRTHDPGYDTPVYRRPPDLVTADMRGPDGAVTGRKQRGRMEDGRLVPYYDRAAIDGGALAGQGLEIAWVKDPIEFFFLQIQGSGRIRLPDGSVMRIGYDGQNGRDYVGIGSVMRQRGLLDKSGASMQGMMAWLRDNPDQGRQLMELNKSFVFFHELTGAGPIGALGVAVTGHISVAADPRFVPLGAPVWLSTDRPEANGLWVAQDTGGAIKGANRFDTFWGAGALARLTAGGMSARGQAFLLLPRGVVARLTAPTGAGYGGAPARP